MFLSHCCSWVDVLRVLNIIETPKSRCWIIYHVLTRFIVVWRSVIITLVSWGAQFLAVAFCSFDILRKVAPQRNWVRMSITSYILTDKSVTPLALNAANPKAFWPPYNFKYKAGLFSYTVFFANFWPGSNRYGSVNAVTGITLWRRESNAAQRLGTSTVGTFSFSYLGVIFRISSVSIGLLQNAHCYGCLALRKQSTWARDNQRVSAHSDSDYWSMTAVPGITKL